jgi:hypothetical protein
MELGQETMVNKKKRNHPSIFFDFTKIFISFDPLSRLSPDFDRRKPGACAIILRDHKKALSQKTRCKTDLKQIKSTNTALNQLIN